MIQLPQSKNLINQPERESTVSDATVDFGFDRHTETKDGPDSSKMQHLRGSTKLRKMDGDAVAVTFKNAIESTIGKRVHELQVSIEDDCVIVTATAPSFYVRQLVEHKFRSIVEEHLNKTFVSRVVVS